MYLKVAEQDKFSYISLLWKKLWQCGVALNGDVLQSRKWKCTEIPWWMQGKECGFAVMGGCEAMLLQSSG